MCEQQYSAALSIGSVHFILTAVQSFQSSVNSVAWNRAHRQLSVRRSGPDWTTAHVRPSQWGQRGQCGCWRRRHCGAGRWRDARVLLREPLREARAVELQAARIALHIMTCSSRMSLYCTLQNSTMIIIFSKA